MARDQLVIATRESPLAIAQAVSIKQMLENFYAGLRVHLLGLTTAGDTYSSASLGAEMDPLPLVPGGGKGLFVKELEEALLENRADIAVHSLKDMPMSLPAGLLLGAYCKRVDPRDVLISHKFASLADLPSGARVGTASLRRQSQLYHLRRDIRIEALRGNINTRLDRLLNDEFDAILLAAAGILRLAITQEKNLFIFPFAPTEVLPAAGQGILGIECREEDAMTRTLIEPLVCDIAEKTGRAERALARHLGGGCDIPLGSYAEPGKDHTLILAGCVGSNDGKYLLRSVRAGADSSPETLGILVAEDLLSQGAAALLAKDTL